MKPIVSLQCMRAVAAILVVFFHHMNTMRDGPAPGMPLFEIGKFGVDIFFIISGFIMWTTVSDRTTPAQFIKRRIVRIVPLYWTMTLATAFVTTTGGGIGVSLDADYARLAKSLLFIPQWHQVYPIVAPYMIVGWTLELEMLFYVLFALALALPKPQRLVAVSAVLAALAAFGLVVDPQNAVLKGFTNNILVEFAMGMGLGRLYELGRAPKSALAGAGLIAAGVALVSIHRLLPEARFIYFGVPALLIMAGALAFEERLKGRFWTAPKFLGDASYSIYLVHLMAMAVSTRIVSDAFAGAFPAAALLFEVAFAVAAGCAAYLLVEKPLTDGARRLIAPRARPAEIVKGL